MADAPKICFVIVGLPRSGTSSIAQFFDHLGVYFGDPSHFLDTNKYMHNPIFYELQWLDNFNLSLLKALTPPKTRNCDLLPIETDFQRPEIVAFREPLQKQFLEEFGDRTTVGVKAPLICFTFPLWHSVLTEMGYTVRTVLSLRSASAIFRSNLTLTPKTLSHVISRWQRWYVRHLLAIRYFTRDVQLCHFDYDLLMRQPLEYGKEKAAELGLAIPDPAAATRHLSTEHYHYQPDDAGTGDPWVDQIESDLRAGRLDPNEYLMYSRTAMLFEEELWNLEIYVRARQAQDSAALQTGTASAKPQGPGQPTMQQWFQEHQRLRAILQQGGRFDVEPRPDGSINIKRLSQ
jgi:hypothetical protein